MILGTNKKGCFVQEVQKGCDQKKEKLRQNQVLNILSYPPLDPLHSSLILQFCYKLWHEMHSSFV